jgi:hypothetical protein
MYQAASEQPRKKGVPREAMSVATLTTEVSQQTVEVKFEGEQVGVATPTRSTPPPPPIRSIAYPIAHLTMCMWCTSMRVMIVGWRPTAARDSAKVCWGRSSRSWLKLSLVSEFPRTTSADELALYSPNDLEVEDFSEHD